MRSAPAAHHWTDSFRDLRWAPRHCSTSSHGAGGHALAVAALRLHAGRMELAASERRLAEHFTAAHPHIPVVQIPAQPEDVHDLDGLAAIGESFLRA